MENDPAMPNEHTGSSARLQEWSIKGFRLHHIHGEGHLLGKFLRQIALGRDGNQRN
jgi:hypothetical protein